jgi:hypothetical protein
MERRAAPIKKRGKTIDPSRIDDIESWLNAYKQNYINVVLGEDGSYLVLDPVRITTDPEGALREPVKSIPHLTGDDYATVLAAGLGAPAELRAAAEAKLETLRSGIAASVEPLATAFLEEESAFLEAVANWKSAPDPATRTTTAQEVGRAAARLAAAETALQEAKYPRRYIRVVSDYGKGEDPSLSVGVPAYANVTDRVVKRGAATNAAAAGAATEEGTA